MIQPYTDYEVHAEEVVLAAARAFVAAHLAARIDTEPPTPTAPMEPGKFNAVGLVVED